MSKRPLEDASLDLRSQLAQILGKDVALVGKIRKTDDEPARLSVIDVASNITGLVAREAARALRRIIETHPDLGAKCPLIKFHGRGKQDTPVAPIETIVEIIFLLPGKTAARIRSEAAKLLVRYLGGDVRLVQEVQQMAHVQKHLGENAPEHPLRIFAAATSTVQSHFASIEAAGVIDTTGYGNDPHGLLKRGHLLAGDEGKAKQADQVKISEFLRAKLPPWQHKVIPSIQRAFGAELLKRKLESQDTLLLHMNLGRPHVTYFKDDDALMQEIFDGMQDLIQTCLYQRAEDSIAFLTAMGYLQDV